MSVENDIIKLRRIEHHLEHESMLLSEGIIDNRLRLKKMNGEKVNVLFICHRPQVWNSLKTVYEALDNDAAFNVKILAIPNKKQLPDKGFAHEIYESEGAEEFWKEYGCINGYNYETGEWLDPRELRPDYVFFQQPYNVCRSKLYKSWIVSKYAKICYVPYGFEISNGEIFESVHPADFMKNIKFFFSSGREHDALIKDWFKIIDNVYTDVRLTGMPRCDLLSKIDSKKGEKHYSFLWIPRWATSEGNSYFFDFKDLLLDFCDKNKNSFSLIFRPHPQAFLAWNATGELTTEEAEDYLKKYRIRKNTIYDTNIDYIKTFMKADCMVSDFGSLMFEFIMTGRPVVYCRKTDCLNDYSEKIASTFYQVHGYEELTKTLRMLQAGNDPLKEARQKMCQEMFYIPSEGVGMAIKNIIKTDACIE